MKEKKKKEEDPSEFSSRSRKKRNAAYSIKKEKEGREIKVGRWRATRANVAFHRRSFFLPSFLPFSPVLSSASREFHMDDIHSIYGASHAASRRVSSRGFFSTSSNVDSIRTREKEREEGTPRNGCAFNAVAYERRRRRRRIRRIKMWTEGIKITGRRLSRR